MASGRSCQGDGAEIKVPRSQACNRRLALEETRGAGNEKYGFHREEDVPRTESLKDQATVVIF